MFFVILASSIGLLSILIAIVAVATNNRVSIREHFYRVIKCDIQKPPRIHRLVWQGMWQLWRIGWAFILSVVVLLLSLLILLPLGKFNSENGTFDIQSIFGVGTTFGIAIFLYIVIGLVCYYIALIILLGFYSHLCRIGGLKAPHLKAADAEKHRLNQMGKAMHKVGTVCDKTMRYTLMTWDPKTGIATPLYTHQISAGMPFPEQPDKYYYLEEDISEGDH